MEKQFTMEVIFSKDESGWFVFADHPVTDKQEAYELVADWNGEWGKRSEPQPDIKSVSDILEINVYDPKGRRLSKGSIAAHKANITRKAAQAA